MREVICVNNVKCNGCANAIEKALITIPEVTYVVVDIQTGVVTIEGNTLDRAELTKQLSTLGYPEKMSVS